MLIKLTYYGTDRPTLVNINNVESIYQVFDKVLKRFSTKICFKGNESYINVEEELQTILRLAQEVQEGKYQDHDWESPSLEERLENNFQQFKSRPSNNYSREYSPRERNFNNIDTYNENRW
jgi:hypothetical protein